MMASSSAVYILLTCFPDPLLTSRSYLAFTACGYLSFNSFAKDFQVSGLSQPICLTLSRMSESSSSVYDCLVLSFKLESTVLTMVLSFLPLGVFESVENRKDGFRQLFILPCS